MSKSIEFIQSLEAKADEYLQECLSHTKQHATGSGKVVDVMDRHIPTVDYFLNIWLDIVHKETMSRQTWYVWLKNDKCDSEDKQIKSDTIKRITAKFNSLARDIVANEGKGIFYAKNALNMHDKQHIENKQVDKFDFDS
jgi:hypothetical protein